MTHHIWDTTAAVPGKPLMDISRFEPFADGLDHPEGVACGPDGSIYAGGEAGQIYRVSPDGQLEQIATTAGFILGLCLDADSNIYACDSANKRVQRITQDGHVSVHSSGSPDRPMQTPNYPAFDEAGNLYVADSGSWHGNDGCIFRIRPDGETGVFTDQVTAFPNGLAMHPTGSHLYAAVSQTCSVVRVAIEADGSAGTIETIAEFPHNVPDGLAFDEVGNCYLACYTPDVIYRISPANAVEILAYDWESTTLSSPTNVAFCGPERRTLVVGSLARWHLSRATMPVAGARLFYPSL
jgi:gluconolactonase